MPKFGEIVSPPSKPSKTTFDYPLELLYTYIDSERRHIRQSIVDAGREEVPNPLEQFTELLNAATSLANATKSTEAKAADYTTILLQVLGKMLTTPEIRDRLIDVLKAFQPKPSNQRTQ
jgi:hypothetical protein